MRYPVSITLEILYHIIKPNYVQKLMFLKFQVQHRDEVRTLPNAALNWHHVGHPIPDIVSSVNQVETPMSSNSLAGNSNPLAENPARIVAAIAEVRPPLRPPRRTKSTSRRSASNTPTEVS